MIRTDRDLNRKLDGFEVEENPLFCEIRLVDILKLRRVTALTN